MKLRSTVGLLFVSGAVLLAPACSESEYVLNPQQPPFVVRGNGIVVEQVREIADCSGVTLRGVGELYIRQGARTELRVRAEQNLMQYLRTEVQGGELLIWKEHASLANTRPIEYHLTVASLNHAVLDGAGGILGTDLTTGALELRLSGVGTIELVNLSAQRLDVESSGVGDVVVSGSTTEQAIELRSMGSYDGRQLSSADADVAIGDGGSATVRVRDRLSATISGSGSVYYLGNPVVVHTISGSGRVVQLAG